MNLAENLDRTARARGRSAAVVLGDEVTSFAEVDHWSRRVAGFLDHQGVRSGDRVGLMLPDVLEFAALYYGILRLGAVVVPMNPHLTEPEVHHRLQDCGATALLAGSASHEAVGPGARPAGVAVWLLDPGGLPDLMGDAPSFDATVPRDAVDTAVIAYTAGTTALPRGAELTHGNLLRNCEVVVNDLVQLTSDDVVLGGLPLCHSFAQTAGLNAAIRAGACLVLLGHLDAGAALGTMHERGVTVMQAGPATYDALLRHPRRADDDFSRLRVAMSGGAALPVEVLLAFEESFDCQILEGYGLVEAPVAGSNRMDRRRVGSIGVPVNGAELRVVDDTGDDVEVGEPGEIVVRGHHVMKGYWGRPQETAATIVDGWLHTGDAGVKDDDGFFYVVGRTNELIVRGGLKVFPREIEDVLHEHEAVLGAVVTGVPHPSLGEEVHAVVTLRPGASTTPGELRDFVRGRVADHKYPREIDIVEEILPPPTDKIRNRAIRLETRA